MMLLTPSILNNTEQIIDKLKSFKIILHNNFIQSNNNIK